MTKIADITSAIETIITATLPTYTRAPNAYAMTENTALLLQNAYGIAVGPGTNTLRYVGCNATWQREFTIGLCTTVITTENDTSGRFTVEKNILEAQRDLFIAFEKKPSLNSTAIRAEITGDSGIEYIDGTSSQFVVLEMTLAVEYQEPLN